MTKDEIVAILAVLIGVPTLIQIVPIKLNPWSWLAKRIGKALNGEVINKVDKISAEVCDLRAACDEREAINCRARITRFGDELLHSVRHSKEHFEQILQDIDAYEQYCSDHPKFKNQVAVITIDRIKSTYAKQLETNDFL